MNSLSPTRPSPRRRLSSPVQQPLRRRQQLSPSKANTSNNNFRNMVAKYSPQRPVISRTAYPRPNVAVPRPYKRQPRATSSAQTSAQTYTEQTKGGMSLLAKAGYGVLSLGAIAAAIYAYTTSGGTFSKDLFKIGGLGGYPPNEPNRSTPTLGDYLKYVKYLLEGPRGVAAGAAVAVGGYGIYRNMTMFNNQNSIPIENLLEQRFRIVGDTMGGVENLIGQRFGIVRDTMGGGVENGEVRDDVTADVTVEVRDDVTADVTAAELVLSNENTEDRMINTTNHEETKTEQRVEQTRRRIQLLRKINDEIDSFSGKSIPKNMVNTRFP
jgi:hypothetical protein